MTIINDKSAVVYENGIGQFEKKNVSVLSSIVVLIRK